jgi:uncharacterized protein DUF4407
MAMRRLRTFTIGLAGGRGDILEHIPSAQARFENLGWSILIVSCMAGVSMWLLVLRIFQFQINEQISMGKHGYGDFIERLQALAQLSRNDFTLAAAQLLLFLLFLVIECLPVTVKLLQRPGQYEAMLQAVQDAERREFMRAFAGRSKSASGDSSADFRHMWSHAGRHDPEISEWHDTVIIREILAPPSPRTFAQPVSGLVRAAGRLADARPR